MGFCLQTRAFPSRKLQALKNIRPQEARWSVFLHFLSVTISSRCLDDQFRSKWKEMEPTITPRPKALHSTNSSPIRGAKEALQIVIHSTQLSSQLHFAQSKRRFFLFVFPPSAIASHIHSSSPSASCAFSLRAQRSQFFTEERTISFRFFFLKTLSGDYTHGCAYATV